ncbi:hypothetical protein [Xylanimonas ulmi]|uniref:Uncharacterized protein n=1 Tax=Xylanimonas ulmi TaxID=228973 RepID=A0A4Q7M204_9MICO|nr:hypothetical protein [Xylanibacterium ulmi]RZS60448.1 hypothetical protein EV386_0706 [Xylanibacterium ulmi]
MKTYRQHRCARKHRTERAFMRCALPRAVWVVGEGAYAVIAWCRVTTVSLHEELDSAEASKRLIDNHGCGGACRGAHEIVLVER